MEDTKGLGKNAGFKVVDIKLCKALSLRDGGDYGTLKIWKII